MSQTITVADAKARLSGLVAAVDETQQHVDGIYRNRSPWAAYVFVTERLPTNPRHVLSIRLRGDVYGVR